MPMPPMRQLRLLLLSLGVAMVLLPPCFHPPAPPEGTAENRHTALAKSEKGAAFGAII